MGIENFGFSAQGSQGQESGMESVATVEYKGVTYAPYEDWTVREWYSHSTEEKGPGPGWDFRQQLLDEPRSQALYGRTFSTAEIYASNVSAVLPDLPYMREVKG